jgi:hypothetical protein
VLAQAAAATAQSPKTGPDQITEQCALVTSRATTNDASKRLLAAASVRIAEPLMRTCTAVGRIMVSKTTVPLRGKVANRRTAEFGMFSIT